MSRDETECSATIVKPSSSSQWRQNRASQMPRSAWAKCTRMAEGVPPDNVLAAYWYRKAADHVPHLGGAGVGLSSLVQLYRDGHATSQDYEFVYRAVRLGRDAKAMRELAKKMNTNQLAEAQRRTRTWFQPRSVCSSAIGKDVTASRPQ
jgi:hypothetical protein